MTGRYVTYAAWLGALGVFGVAVAGCGETPAEKPPGSVVAEDVAKGSADAPPKRAALTAKLLSPVVIQELGTENTVPGSIVIELAAPVIDYSDVGRGASKERLLI